MNHIDLFSGIGGFSLAARWCWGEQHKVKSFCEIDPYCQRVIKKHWPGVPIHDDIKTLNAKPWRGAIDLVTGGFPCQPYSLAGKRGGSSDDRALWPEMRRVIEECQPRWVVGENVPGILTMEFEPYSFEMESYGSAIEAALRGEVDIRAEIGGWAELVFCDITQSIEELGYEVVPITIPACAVDAPHIRSRIWILAHSMRAGRPERRAESRIGQASGRGGNVADSNSQRRQQKRRSAPGNESQNEGRQANEDHKLAGDGEGDGKQDVAQPNRRRLKRRAQSTVGSACGEHVDGCRDDVANAESERCGDGHDGELQRQASGEVNALTSASCTQTELEARRWKIEPAMGVLVNGLSNGLVGCSDGDGRFAGRVARGIKNRVPKLKGLGNAIVPQVAFQIFEFIKQIESESTELW